MSHLELKLREVKKFARITQPINSRAKIQTEVCVAQEPVFFTATCSDCHMLCQFSGDEGPRPVILR